MLQLEVKYKQTEATCNISRHLGEDKRFLFATMPCGKEVRNAQYVSVRGGNSNWVRRLDYKNINDVAQAHVYRCVTCQLKLVGFVKRNVMTQQDVADLFIRGVDGKRTPVDKDKSSGDYNYHYSTYYGTGQSNVYSENNILWHYNTIEAIRLSDGTIVDNSQCWCKGRAYCPSTHGKYTLPLTTLSKEYNDNLIDNLIVGRVNIKSDNAVFKIRDSRGKIRQLMYDWYHDFLDELPEQCDTLDEAEDIQKPVEVIAAKGIRGITHQGEFWFIPLKGLQDSEVADIRHAGREGAYDNGQYLDKKHSHRATRTGTINYYELDRWFDTKGQSKLTALLAKGTVIHTTRRWRKRDKLGDGKTWHAVFENRSVRRIKLR